MTHPVVPPTVAQWIQTGLIAVTAAGAYVYLEGLREDTAHVYAEILDLGQEQRDLDRAWLADDDRQHGEILTAVEGVRAYLDGSRGELLYELGLRDGARACR